MTSGVVLIDEVDLHLHPELQSVILQSLRNVFPNLQFVVSSHAPMVLSSVETGEDNEVVNLAYTDGTYTALPTVTYGMDASTILEAYMGNRARVEEVENRLNRLFSLIDDERYAEARAELSAMRNRHSDTLPELSRAESMLSFLED